MSFSCSSNNKQAYKHICSRLSWCSDSGLNQPNKASHSHSDLQENSYLACQVVANSRHRPAEETGLGRRVSISRKREGSNPNCGRTASVCPVFISSEPCMHCTDQLLHFCFPHRRVTWIPFLASRVRYSSSCFLQPHITSLNIVAKPDNGHSTSVHPAAASPSCCSSVTDTGRPGTVESRLPSF